MRVSIVVAALVSLVLCLLPSFISAQNVAPTLTSATLSADGLQIYLIWQSNGATCPGVICYYQVLQDGTVQLDRPGFSAQYTTYYDTINVDASKTPDGVHTFSVQMHAIGPASTGTESNAISVNVQQPQATTPGGTIAGDPQFTGLRGQSYQVHGVPDEVFSIVSDVDLQYNSRFVLLQKGECPMVDGKVLDTPCYTHPGTYLGELAIETAAGDRVYIKAGSASTGFEQVLLNDEQVNVGEHHKLKAMEGRAQGYVRLQSSHRITVQAGNFWFEFTNSDMFVNQRVAMLDAKAETSHGLLGQTWSTVIYDAASTIPWIEGSVFDYAMADHQLFSHRFIFNKFQVNDSEETEEAEDEEEAEEEESKLLERLKRITAARTRAGGKVSSSKKAHTHGHVNEWDL